MAENILERELFDLCLIYQKESLSAGEPVTAVKKIRQWMKRYENDSARFKAAACYAGYYGTGLHLILLGSLHIPPSDIVETWMKQAPESAKIKCNLNLSLTLHSACFECQHWELHHKSNSLDRVNWTNVIMAALDASPPLSANTKNRCGSTPLQMFMRTAETKDENEMLPLHFMAAYSKNLTVSFLEFLIAAYPRGIELKDDRGILPLQYAFLNKSSSVEVLMHFVKLSPEIVQY
mmetsp:Transcript_17155/g.24452  ORF Transcript_17155/g.24452 Transcript_17155/m.24452 type:complete len:235 (+) Transcript_17155:69-773(+)